MNIFEKQNKALCQKISKDIISPFLLLTKPDCFIWPRNS